MQQLSSTGFYVPLSERFYVEPAREPTAIEVLEVAHGLRSIEEFEPAMWVDSSLEI